MAWAIEFHRHARRELAGLPSADRRRVALAMEKLADNPRLSPNARALGGEEGYRLRVGDYRVLYFLEEERVVVAVVRIAHRKEVYR